jgi:hypothetical protein
VIEGREGRLDDLFAVDADMLIKSICGIMQEVSSPGV